MRPDVAALTLVLTLAATPASAAATGASGGVGAVHAPAGAEACVGARSACALAPGISYRQLRLTAPRPAVVHLAEIDLSTPGLVVRVTPADRSGGMEYRAQATSRYLVASGAVLAVNASYFLPFVGGSPAGQDFVPQPGQAADASGAVLAGGETVSPADAVDARVDSMACLAPGRAWLVDGQACPEGATDGVAAGPRLLRAGQPVPRPQLGPDGRFHGATALPPGVEGRPGRAGPRTALGISRDGQRLWLAVVDGRQPGWSEGATHDELAVLLRAAGAHEAMSLDGGGSATMVARGPAGPVLLSRPIHTGVPGRERPVANHLGVFVGERPGRFLALPQAESRPVRQLEAVLERVYQAPEARQGVAVDGQHFYAVVNTVIAKYRRDSGALVARWVSPRGGLVRHLNSCRVVEHALVCANSNHPEVPMGSSVEWFSRETLTPLRSHSLGLMDEGSLTFVEPMGAGWLLGFAHYSDETGVPFKPSDYSSVVAVDAGFRKTGGWLIPPAIRKRMAPQAASGGAIGADGLLYLFGHDRPEMYVLARPARGPELLHVATIAVDAAGQAFAFDPEDGRRVFTIDRPTGEVRVFRLPEVGELPADALRFEVAGPAKR